MILETLLSRLHAVCRTPCSENIDNGELTHCLLETVFRYYCNISAKKRLEKCVELLAHDCASLVYRAFALKRVYHEELLRIFLTFDDMKEVRRFKSCLHGVRRAQVKLATNYLVDGEEEFAKRIRDDMDVEDSSTLQGLWEEIVSLNRRDFWE